MSAGSPYAGALTPEEARVALKAVAWFATNAKGALLGEEGAALLSAREKLQRAAGER